MALSDLLRVPQPSLAVVITKALTAYFLAKAIYRLYFSPIANFPGPKLAALTLWYEFYYDVYLGGQYVFKIRQLHKEHGPIIRISPYELHVETPRYYEELFAGSTQKRDKYEWHTKLFGTPDAAFGTVDHNLHRMRRSAMNPFFSKANVRRLQPVIQARVDKLLERIKEFQASGKPLTISLAYTAYSSDVITEYTFGRSYHRLDQEDFDPAYAQSIHEGASASHFNKQIIWPFRLLLALPSWLGTLVAPGLSMYVSFINDCREQITAIKNGSNNPQAKTSHATVFHELLEADLPPSEKSIDRLVQEGQVIVSAGTETTAWTLSVTTFFLLANPNALRKLREELEVAFPDPSQVPALASLEQLPYLHACIQEGLRLSYGVSSRLQRISPEKPMIFNDGERNWEIPAGTPTSMTAYLVHHNETIFPSSYEYRPERWLGGPRLDRYLVSFTKGSRQCVGINLAYAELYTGLAAIFRRYSGPDSSGPEGKLELFETTKDDVVMIADKFVPFVKAGSQGIRVLVKK